MLEAFDKAKYDEILGRGLCTGVGESTGQMCIEAAISQAMGLPFNDEPACVLPVVRAYKIRLNDSARWKSAESRAAGMYDLGVAQLGSNGTVGSVAFTKRMAELHIRELVPHIFRIVFAGNPELLELADRCEAEGTKEAAYAAAANADSAAYAAAYANAAAYAAANAAYAAANAAYAAADAAAAAYANAANAAANAANAANAAANAANAANAEAPLLISASICLRVLRELSCPGVALLDQIKGEKNV
jgi:hypothetical protein